MSIIQKWRSRVFKELPNSPEKLLEHAEVLHKEAKDALETAIVLGACLGMIISMFMVVAISIGPAIFEAWRTGGLDAVLSPVTHPPLANRLNNIGTDLWFGAFFGFLIGGGIGLHWGKRRMSWIRFMATVELSLARIEAKMSKPEESEESPNK